MGEQRRKFEVEISRSAQREFRRLDAQVQTRVARVINALADNPRPRGCVQLQGEDGIWRVREGDWRVLYTIDDAVVIVLVVSVAHRREAYRRR